MDSHIRNFLVLSFIILVSIQFLSCVSEQGLGKTTSMEDLVETQPSTVKPFNKNLPLFLTSKNDHITPGSMGMVLTQSNLAPRELKTKLGPLFTISVQDADVKTILISLSKEIAQNILIDPSVSGLVSVDLKDVTLKEALDALLNPLELRYRFEKDFIKVETEKMETRVFHLNYIISSRTGTSNIQASGGSQISGASMARSSEGTENLRSSSSLVSRENSDLWNEITEGILNIVASSSDKKTVAPINIPATKTKTNSIGATTSESVTHFPVERKVTSYSTTTEKALQTATIRNTSVGYVSINRLSGLIIVRNYPDILMRVAEYLEAVEGSSQRQVLIQAKILEVTLSENFQMGVDWSKVSPIEPKHEAPSRVSKLLSEPPGQTYRLSNTSISLITKTLAEQGQVSVLSSPKIATLNNQRAVIKVGTEDVFFVPQTTAATTNMVTSTTTFQPATVTVGIILDVVPQINPNGDVMMSINTSISERSGIATSPDGINQVPILNVRESNNVVLAQNGQTVIIGGLIQEQETKEVYALPLLSEIPLLGSLFEREIENTSKAELVIMLTPEVIVGEKINDL